MEANYRKEKTEKVLEKYRDLVDKTFDVIDMDKLDAELRKAENEEGSEARLLTKITNRKKALEHIEDFLERIESLENKQNNKTEEPINKESVHPTKLYAKK